MEISKRRLRRSRIGQGWFGVRWLGHRSYVGGQWKRIGRLQYEFLLDQGLQPSDVLADVGCGALRAGVHLVPYLDAGNYLGLEKERALIRAGVRKELGKRLVAEKRPELVVSDDFEFHRFSKRPNVAIAQSLFTHLVSDAIVDCLTKLRAQATDDCRLFATFFEGDPGTNPDASHDHRSWRYTQEQMHDFGARAGWTSTYIGDWNHPRNQRMVLYQPA